MTQVHDLVILGAGQAAVQLAMSLRQAGDARSIAMIGDEPCPPYSRPPLSKGFLKGLTEREDLFFRQPEWFAESGISLHTGVRALSVDVANRVIQSDHGAVRYRQLVFATGTRPRTLPVFPGELTNVVYLRDLADATRLVACLPSIRHATVIGGGFIGLEFAAVMRGLGRAVTVVEAGPRLMGRAVSPVISDWFLDLHRGHGVDVRLNRCVEGTETGAGSVRAVHLNDGTRLATDIVVVGVGVIPNDDLARAAGIAVEDGILVDDRLRASVPDVFAIGDCARMQLPDRTTQRLESVQNAADQARHLAAGLTGRDAAYRVVPWFWSDQYDRKLQIAGLRAQATRPSGHALQVGGFSIEHHAQDRLVCVESVNDARGHLAARKSLNSELMSGVH